MSRQYQFQQTLIDETGTRQYQFGQTLVDEQSNVTLVSAPATFTLTGQSSAMNVSRVLASTQASFVITTKASAMNVARQLVSAHATYTITPKTSAMNVALVLTSAHATYTITPQASVLTSGYFLTSAHATFSITPQVTIFYPSTPFTLATAPAVYVVKGQVPLFRLSSGIGTPQVPRVSDFENDKNRARRFSEITSDIFNSLLTRGDIVQVTGPTPFKTAVSDVDGGTY